MKINLPLFSQRDDRWKAKKLGTSSVTIGGYGCLLTCLTMVAKYYGKDTDPDRMNDELKRVNGYSNGNLYIWNSINKIYADISEPKRIDTPQPLTSAQFNSIEAEIAAGRPVIAEVDFIPATSNVDMHFVVIIGKEGDQWIVADPWFGDVASLGRYGVPAKTIQKYVFTFGPIPTQPVDDPTHEQSQALAVITEGYKALPEMDNLKLGNEEGYARAVVEEHKSFASNLAKAKDFESFIDKWYQEWHLTGDANKSKRVQLEEEMGKYLHTEDRLGKHIDEVEKLVGKFEDDGARLKALEAVKEDKNRLTDDLEKCEIKLKKGKIIKTFTIGKYVIKITQA